MAPLVNSVYRLRRRPTGALLLFKDVAKGVCVWWWRGCGGRGYAPFGFSDPRGPGQNSGRSNRNLLRSHEICAQTVKRARQGSRGPSKQGPGTREPGGGAVGAACPHNLEAVGALPPTTLDGQCVIFYFCLFLHMNLGLTQKIVGQIRGVFNFG